MLYNISMLSISVFFCYNTVNSSVMFNGQLCKCAGFSKNGLSVRTVSSVKINFSEGVHLSCYQLKRISWKSKEITIVLHPSISMRHRLITNLTHVRLRLVKREVTLTNYSWNIHSCCPLFWSVIQTNLLQHLFINTIH